MVIEKWNFNLKKVTENKQNSFGIEYLNGNFKSIVKNEKIFKNPILIES